ncbi:MAG: type IV toxin-antitoxin system AbiEi family antitoxin domain-containing protein [Solirubrobacterales bacterium]
MPTRSRCVSPGRTGSATPSAISCSSRARWTRADPGPAATLPSARQAHGGRISPARTLTVPMGAVKVRAWSQQAWELTDKQHGVVTHSQLRGLGLSPAAIRHRLTSGRLRRLMRGVYVVGRPGVDDRARWMAAVLVCGPDARLSHRSAAALLRIRKSWRGPVEVVVPPHLRKRLPDIHAYRLAEPWTAWSTDGSGRDPRALRFRTIANIPVTSPVVTLVDLATCLPTGQLEAAVNEADHLNLVDPEALRAATDDLVRRPGARRLRDLLDTATHALTATELEHRFLPLAIDAGLPLPKTQARRNGHRVDFYWPELGLVVETDSLRYHRTAFKQGEDVRRDNAHTSSGLTTLRFTHGQVCHEPDYVRAELRRMAARLTSSL